ncbi:penicillin-binding protein 2 [Phormidium sp. FACHB-592]|uniref:Penicillin-binding protein 2 n=1 Tax=Stenomitos frigidus AS-A4 TaxID=2933935 RepID=A0ABV0KQS7_9CYAN|nr:penicillin-binding protein 2 [Phormidium sp. FACHB-592]MBD2072956.1 penicillin-binding protein 2 [Phormidium sp. FACHB-592]
MTLTQPSTVVTQTTPRTVGRRYQSIALMLGVSLVMMVGMGSRLVYLQLVEGDRNQQLAENNRIRLIPKQPERGKILDRKGRMLAGSRLSHSVFLWPLARKKAEWATTLQRLSQILNVPEATIKNRLEQAGYNSPFLVRIARGVSPAQVTALAEYGSQMEGVQVDAEAVRYYPNGDLAAHVLGYTGEMDDRELEKRKSEGYRLGDVIGQMGVESTYETLLRGEWGGQQVEVDGEGQVVRVLGKKPTQAGKDVQLTLDLELQKAAETALGNRKGAIVAIDPTNGAVLAMVSRPTFDPNLFSTRITDAQWQRLQSEDHPFVNRAIQGFPPASTFKIVTTTAALETGKFSPDTVLGTYPSITVGGIEFGDWNRAGFGPLGFVGAMQWSSDTFFYQIGMGVGDRDLIQWTRRYGFGRKTGIDLSEEESAGLVPDEEWKRKEVKEGWYLGDTVNMSIGQGFLQTTPLQVAVMFAVPANDGYLVKPHLLKDNEAAQNWREPLNLKPETVRILREGLRAVIDGGTGEALNVASLPPMSGKSGTAEDIGRESHTWFGAYGPTAKPEIVVVAFGENSGGGGGSFAAPMVRQVLAAYFNPKKKITSPSQIEPVQTD